MLALVLSLNSLTFAPWMNARKLSTGSPERLKLRTVADTVHLSGASDCQDRPSQLPLTHGLQVCVCVPHYFKLGNSLEKQCKPAASGE
jgi:hypothetical protein